MEAECVSLCEAIKEALSLKLFLEELDSVILVPP